MDKAGESEVRGLRSEVPVMWQRELQRGLPGARQSALIYRRRIQVGEGVPPNYAPVTRLPPENRLSPMTAFHYAEHTHLEQHPVRRITSVVVLKKLKAAVDH